MQRLRYFDILKGIAIFLVVMGHVLAICIRGIDHAATFKLIGQIHMPLFFFISGWLAMRLNPDWTPRPTPIIPKIKRLLLPAAAVSLLWVWYYPCSGLQSPFSSDWCALLADEWKYGYWFTPVLFIIFLLYIPTVRLFPARPALAAECGITATVWIGLYALECALPSGTNGYLSLPLIRNFYPVFMAGAIARRHSEAFGRLTASPNAVAAAIAVFAVTVSYVAWYWRYPFDTPLLRALVQPVMHLSIAVVAIAVVRPWSETAFGPSAPSDSHPLARMWEYIGSRSLAVYLLHYFFLFPMGGIRPLLEAVDFARVPLIVISALVAAIIVGVVLLTDHILSFAGPLYLLLTGSVKTKPENK